MKLDAVKEIKVVSTNISAGCPFGCTLPYNGESFADNVNHYLQKHGYKLLHVGQESSPDDEGKAYHATVAVLAKP